MFLVVRPVVFGEGQLLPKAGCMTAHMQLLISHLAWRLQSPGIDGDVLLLQEASAKFQSLQRIYAVLSDPKKWVPAQPAWLPGHVCRHSTAWPLTAQAAALCCTLTELWGQAKRSGDFDGSKWLVSGAVCLGLGWCSNSMHPMRTCSCQVPSCVTGPTLHQIDPPSAASCCLHHRGWAGARRSCTACISVCHAAYWLRSS